MSSGARNLVGKLDACRELSADYLRAARLSRRNGHLVDDLATYCMFIGYPRSGHSLVGSLLNAHRNVVIAHELDVLRLVRARFGRRQLLALILERDRWFETQDRIWSDYRYSVPGQWQGKFDKLCVIGDKKGSASTHRLRLDPGLLDRLRATVNLPLRIVHVVRNPFDNIATMFRRSQKGIDYSIGRYFSRVQTVSRLRATLPASEILDVRLESLIGEPRSGLQAICAFLGIGAPDDYLAACAAVVFDSPRRTRFDVPWTDGLIEQVAERAAAYDFLASYGFDD